MLNSQHSTTTLAVLVGSRGFFPGSLVEEGRKQVLETVRGLNYDVVTLTPEDTEYGAVETRRDAKKCADLFDRQREDIDGILITLPNFGDEKAVAETLRKANLDVPVLVHGFPDKLDKMDIDHRRDAFCGKLSVCNNLNQYGISFTNTTEHVEDPAGDTFRMDLQSFASTCSVVNGLSRARIGAIGARTAPFNTVRFSEKILERGGIAVETIDLSEIIGKAESLDDNSDEIRAKISRIKNYVTIDGVPNSAIIKLAKLLVTIKEWISINELDAVAVQCWSAIEEYFGVVPCTPMSLLSEEMIPSACEVDVMGALSMYALQLASGKPSALSDWNNNYGRAEDKVVTFHCSNYPASFFKEMRMGYQDILADDLGKQNTYGTCIGRINPGPATFFRLSTDDNRGKITSYLAQGKFTDDELVSFGGYGVAEIPRLEELLDRIATDGFEHHVAVSRSHVGKVLREALHTYLGWDLYCHNL